MSTRRPIALCVRPLAILLGLTLALAARPGAATTALDALVAQVSQSMIEAHVATLAAAPRDDVASQAAAAAYIEAELQSYGYATTRQAVPSVIGTSDNVVARLEGMTTPNDVVVVGAHYDSVLGSPGADDNASGVAGMLEIARVLAGTPLPWSVEFVAYAHEELGLLGSTVHAQDAVDTGRNVVAMYSLEMIGYTCAAPCQFPFIDVPPCLDVSITLVTSGTFIGLVANTASGALVEGFEAAAARYAPHLLAGSAEVAANGGCFPDTRRSDHAPYWDRGFAAMQLTDTANFRNPNYHQSSDLPATLDYVLATDVTRALLATVATQLAPAEVGIASKKLVVVDKPSAGSAKLVFVAKGDANIDKGAAGDEALLDGALQVFYSNKPDSSLGAFVLPAPWVVNKDAVAKYVNTDAPTAGAVTVGVVKPANTAKVVAKDLGDGRRLDLFIGEPEDDGVTAILTTINAGDGSSRRMCSRFSTDDGSTLVYKEIAAGTGRKLVAKNGVAIACP